MVLFGLVGLDHSNRDGFCTGPMLGLSWGIPAKYTAQRGAGGNTEVKYYQDMERIVGEWSELLSSIQV